MRIKIDDISLQGIVFDFNDEEACALDVSRAAEFKASEGSRLNSLADCMEIRSKAVDKLAAHLAKLSVTVGKLKAIEDEAERARVLEAAGSITFQGGPKPAPVTLDIRQGPSKKDPHAAAIEETYQELLASGEINLPPGSRANPGPK